MVLTPKQRAHLRSLAHHLKPVAQIGREGVTDASAHAVEEALATRELIKVKVQEAAPLDVRAAAAALAERLEGVQVVQTIGRVAVLYRPHPEQPEIRLPRSSPQ
ncbi:MAG TPA: ribosome assembly RNA-binding protein YhbY [Longimicrobiaceae bacterium]|nr:ribosome assembly RNA-binding protein YhbY [Longimicrobiaceae bacterium]